MIGRVLSRAIILRKIGAPTGQDAGRSSANHKVMMHPAMTKHEKNETFGLFGRLIFRTPQKDCLDDYFSPHDYRYDDCHVRRHIDGSSGRK